MKQLLGILVAVSLMLTITPMVLATSTGNGISPDINTEDFAPNVWMCDDRVVLDDNTQAGRFGAPDTELFERVNNYAFEGEQIEWTVLVMDKNGINKVDDVYVSLGETQAEDGNGNLIEVNCVEDLSADDGDPLDTDCNARIAEEELTVFDEDTMRYYTCTFTVETQESSPGAGDLMYGEYWVTVEAIDMDQLIGTMDENEFWFFNPVISLGIENSLTFDNVRPGSSAYSSTLLVGNEADQDSGVLLDMFISGTDFYDSSSSGAMCPTSNQLVLGDGDSYCDVGSDFGGPDASTDPFCYFASHGAYSTQNDGRNDAEGYVGINYGTTFNTMPFGPGDWYGTFNGDGTGYEIIQDPSIAAGLIYYPGNVVSPGSEMAITFRLNLPEPCNGDFDTGDIFFWGEAI